MGWLKKTFLYRDDYIPALQGLRGLAVLWYFHWSFYSQFDPAKLSRIARGKPWMDTVLNALRLAVAPGEAAWIVMLIICGFLLVRKSYGGADPGRYFLNTFSRIYGLYLLVVLPSLSYMQPDLATIARTLVFLEAPAGFPPFITLLGIILAAKLLVFGLTACNVISRKARRGSGAAPLSQTVPPFLLPLAHPVLRYFGAVALPFYLIHTTWGFRLSRSILQGELHSIQAIAAHYAMSLAFSAVFAGFLHVFFEKPSFLRNAPSADTKPSSATQGVSP
jgi:hypothetical protein